MAKRTGNNKMINQMDFQKKKNSKELSEKDKNNLSMKMFADYVQKLGNNNLSNEQKELERNHYQKRTIGNDKNFIKAYEGYPSADQNASPQEVEQYFSNDVPNFFQKYGESLKKENSETAKENLSDYESNYNKFKVQTDKVRGYINRNKNGMTQEQYDDAIEYLRSVRSASMAMRHNFRVYDQYYSSMTKEQASAIDKGYILDDSDLNVTDERVKIRQEQWHKNNARMLELNRQIASIQNQEAKLNTFFDNPGASYNSELNELIAERDRISTEQKRYENGQKKYDDAFKIRSLDDFEKLSEPKDNIPTKADYDAYEADLKAKNNLDAKRKELAKDPTNGLPDKLGTFLRDSEKNLNQAHINRINTNGITSLYEDVLLEGDKKNWSKLTDREIEMYYYKLNEEGQESAYKWLDDLQTELDRRKTNEDYEKAENASALDKILMNVASVPANIIGAPLSFASDVSNIVRDNEINPYDNLHSLQNYAQAVRGVTAKEIDEAFGNKKLKGIDFGFGDAYQSVMSGFDSLVGAGLLGPVYTPFMAMGASSSASKDLYEQGYSKEQVALGGFLAGAAEWFFENKSIENYLNAPDAKTKKGILKNVLQQAGVEASEEIFTELANIVSDVAVKGSMSDWKKWEQDGGISNAIKESVLQATSAGLGGALSGGLMSGVGSSMQYHNYGTMMSDYGSRKVYDADMLLDMAKEGSLPVNMDTTKVQKALDNLQNGEFKNKNFREVGDFVSETEIRLKEQATKRAIKSYIEADRLENGDTSPVTTEEVNRIYDENYRKSDEQITDYETPYVDKAIKNRNLKPSDVSTETQINSASETEPVINSYNDNTEIISNHNEVERNYADIKRNYADIKRDYIDTYRQPDKHIEDSINPYTEETARSREVRSSDIPTEYSPKSYNDYKNANESKYVSTEESMYYTPTRVISSDNGRLTMVNERGEKSVTGNTDYSSQKQAVTYETIASMQTSTNSANQIADMVKNTPDRYISRTMLGIKEAYTYGRIGQRFETIKPNFISDIPVEMAKEAYNLGRTDSMIRPEMQNVNAVQKYDGVKYVGNVNRKSLTKNQRRQIDLVGQIAKNVTGSNVVVYESVLNSNGERVLDVNLPGRMAGQTAPNGIFSSSDGTIYIDANAGNAGSGLIMHTAAHELTHFASQYSDKFDSLREFVVNEFVDNGKDFDSLVMRKMNQNQSLNYYEATEEVIADAMSGMFTNTDSLEKIARLKEHDQTLFEKLKEVFNKLYNKIKDFYTKYSPESIEGQMMLDMKDSLDQVAQLFSETLVDAGEKFQALQKVGLQYDAETESISPDMFSLRTFNESDYVQNIDEAASEISEAIGVDVETAKKYIKDVTSIANMIAKDPNRLDYTDTGLSSFVSNSEYGGSFDYNTLCKKRRLLTGTFTAIQNALPNTALTAMEILDIRKMMDDAGLEVSCGKCYVEGSRANMGVFAKEFLKLLNKYYPDYYQPNMSEINTPDGIEWIRTEHPEVYEQYEYFWNHYGRLRDGDKNLFASQQKPKLYQMRTAYKAEIIKNFKDSDKIDEKNKNGGIRMQSFSDFEIVHLIDAMQTILDMSRVGLNGQAYTKVPEFAWALGDTGLKINLSIDAWEVGEDGKLIFNNKEGMPFETAMKLRDSYSKNVGTICCVYDDKQLLAALADDRIDFIIPFHRSQWKKAQYKSMGLPQTTKDYTYQQNEKWLNPSKHTHEWRGRTVKTKCTNYMPNEYWDFSKSGKENAEAYLEMCARDGKRPKFYKFLDKNSDGSFSLKKDGSTDGYWKLLIDFKMYDNDGVGSPQLPVQPVFNMEECRKMMEEYEGGASKFPVAHGIVDEFVSKYKEGIIAKTSVRGDTLEYGVFESNQFKYADNVEPTSSGDIRYSDRVLMGSYFSGGGTLESGLVYKMLEKEFAVEYDGKIAEVWEDNHGKDKMFVGDVRDFNKNVDDLFYFHASPSCQSSSKSNHKRGETETDITTAQATADRIRSSKPPVVSIENVKEYKDTKSYKIITDTLDELGYTWDANIYKASDYGNPTKRERLLIRAVESGLELPDVPGKVSEKTSWGDATRDLWGDLEQYHLNASTVKAIRNTPGLKNLDLLKQDKALLVYGTNNGGRVDYAWEDELCPTLTTKCGDARIIIDGKVYKPTVEFMGRLQGLPDDFNYTKKTLSFKIIGNGIPVQLTQAVMGGLLDSTYSQTHEGKVLYSERDTETNKQQERTTKFLQKQNEKLKKDNEYLKQLVRLQGKVTDGKVMSRSSIQKVAKQIMTNAGVKGNSEEFYGIIEDLYTYIREGGDEELEAKANSAVDWLVDHHKTVQNRTDDANAVLGHLIGKRIRVTPEQKAEIESQYGSYNDFRKQLFGSVTITTKDDAPTLESMWGEMAELFPYAFDDDTNVLDMPITLLTVVDQMKNSYESDMEEYDFSADMTRQELLTDVYDGYWKVSSLHTVADKYQKQINELKAKHDEEVRKIRQDYTEKLRELKSDYKEQNKNAREYYRQKSEEKIADVRKKQQEATDRKKTTEVRNKVKKIAEDLKSSTWRTKGVTYPEGLVQSVIKICEMIDPTGVDQTTKAAQEYWSARDALRNLRDEYDKMSDYGYDFSSEYDIYLSYYINQLASAVGNKPLRDMDRDQINQVYEILNDIKHCITTATKIYGHEDMKNTFIAGESVMDNMEFIKAKGLTTKAPGKILREWTLNPIRATREMTGYNEDSVLYKLMSDINEGRIKQDMFVMECNKMLEGFRESTKDRKTYNDAVEKEFDFGLTDVKGRPAMISKMQAMQALMTYERAESNEGQKHLEAPVLFLDVKLASKGKLDEAYNNGKVVRVNKDFVNKVTEKLTDWDRAYMATAKKIFNEKAKNAINETTLITKHRIVATDKNYIPYVVNKNELSRDSENLSFNASIENEGMLKRLTLNADTQLIISGLNTILDDHVKRVGKVYGLTVPIRNWNKVFNMKEQRERDQERRTVKKSISNTWGESAVKLLDKAVADMQGSAPRDISKLVTHVKNAFVTSTLASNISVTMKQFASYPTAGAVLSSGSLFKAFGSFMVSGKAQQRLWDEIDAHTPQHYTRRLGMSIQELGEMNQTNGVLNKVNHKMGMMSPMNWIQAFDVRTTQALWNAAKYDAGKKFEKGSEEYWDLATKLYNRTLEDTQPMYDSLHRAQVTKNQQLSTFVMFQTQPLQNSGILHEGYMRRKAMIKMHGRKSVQVKEANKQFRDAVMSQLASHLLFTGMTLLSAFLLHRMNPWRDKNKEVTWESVSEEFGKEFLKNYANAILPFANYIFSAFERVFLDGTYDVLSDPVVDKINGTFTTIDKLKKYPSISTTADFVADILSYFGVPASNVLKIKRGVQMHLTDIKNGTFLEAGVYRTPKEMSDRIYRFKIEGDEEALDAEKKKFSSEPSFYNSLREGLTNNDPRIKKAAKARKAGKMSEYKELAKSIIDEGVFTQNDVVKAINKIINADKEKEEQKESSTIVGFYTKDDVRDAIHDGDLDFITEYQDDYIQTAKDNGKDEDKAKTYAKNNIKAVADEEFESGDIKKEIYAKILSEYCGTDEEEANSIAEYAVYLNNHPDTTIEKKTYAVYNTKYKDQPFTLEEYNDYWENTHDIKGKDLDGDGRSDPYTAMDQYIEYIDSMNISEEKKTALFKIKYPSDKSMERVTW